MQIRAILPDGTPVKARIDYRPHPVVISEDGTELEGVTEVEARHKVVLRSGTRVTLKEPIPPVRFRVPSRLSVVKKYVPEEIEGTYDVYPPSSEGFYARLAKGMANALLVVFELVDSSGYWLTVLEPDSNRVFESHPIKRYEFDIVHLKRALEQFVELVSEFSEPAFEKEIMGLLDGPDLTWEELSHLTRGNLPSGCTPKGNLRDTLRQLLPHGTEDVENEFLLTLEHVARDRIPDIDLVEYISKVGGLPVFRQIYSTHLRLQLIGKPTPDYVSIINKIFSDVPATNIVTRASEEIQRRDPYRRINQFFNFAETFDITHVAEIITHLNSIGDIITATSQVEKYSQDTKARLLIHQVGIRMAPVVNHERIGLQEMIYLGAAHRWPHRHLAYSYRLGDLEEAGPHLQSILVPKNKVDEIQKSLPQFKRVLWSWRVVNEGHFDGESYVDKPERITQGLTEEMTLQALKLKYSPWKQKGEVELTKEEARLLDMVAHHLYISDLDLEAGRRFWKTTPNESRRILRSLQKKELFFANYWMSQGVMPATFVIAKGPPQKIAALSNAFLEAIVVPYTAILGGGNMSVSVLRATLDSRTHLMDIVPSLAKEHGLEIQTYVPQTYMNYRPTLHQRLLREDGSWDDDFSGLLSQIRSRTGNS